MTVQSTTPLQSQPAELTAYMNDVGKRAKAASRAMAKADTHTKNAILSAIIAALENDKAAIIAANATDMQNGKRGGLESSLLDRLELTDARFVAMLTGLREVIALPDPIGEISEMSYRPTGIQLGKMRVPLGVIGMIYESRPNVTVETASLAIKSGNAIILRGGKEAFFTNQAIAASIHTALDSLGISRDVVQVLQTTDRQAVSLLVGMNGLVDVIIPRGGKGLVERVTASATVPVIKHLDGICHTYVADDADRDMAVKVCTNAKTSRYGTCNTMETLLIDSRVADTHLVPIVQAMIQADNAMQFRACERALPILQAHADTQTHTSLATPADWDTEYLAPILAIKVIDGIDNAIDHINTHSSQHTDVIITNDYAKSQQFIREVDSASVMVNASSRFADGFEYGLGAEIGISTDKFHARGPVGLHGLTSQKWIVFGHGEVRV
ncbi:MAG: glutamate-5-semialdehyde dehydrogenase [Moraxella sp.]|nr:glutamate-5-semialdehyde dehydrogenase [Moraxella sp.]